MFAALTSCRNSLDTHEIRRSGWQEGARRQDEGRYQGWSYRTWQPERGFGFSPPGPWKAVYMNRMNFQMLRLTAEWRLGDKRSNGKRRAGPQARRTHGQVSKAGVCSLLLRWGVPKMSVSLSSSHFLLFMVSVVKIQVFKQTSKTRD